MPYVEGKATGDELSTPSETDVSRMVRATVETWKPRRGPDWTELMNRISGGPAPWVVYVTASAALTVILVTAFIIGSWLQIGALAPQPTTFTGH